MSSPFPKVLGVVLAAGKGSRMAHLPTSLPKCVLPVLGKPILAYQLEIFAALGVRRVFIVVGHRGFEIVREVERLPDLGMQIEYVEQHETLGIAIRSARSSPIWIARSCSCLATSISISRGSAK